MKRLFVSFQSESQDQVFLRWTTGETATMHILVVHAMVILLTMGSPKGNPVHCTVFTVSGRTRLTRSLFFSGESDFYALLDIWFPDKKPLPTAFLVDTSEEALLLPDWLKLRMIRSEVSRLVDAGNLLHEGDARSDLSFFSLSKHCDFFRLTALQDLESQQLLLFVQSFGIPVSSMSKLLQYLDQAVSHDTQTLEQNIMDKRKCVLIKMNGCRFLESFSFSYSLIPTQTTWPTWLKCSTSEVPPGGTFSTRYSAPLCLLTKVGFLFYCLSKCSGGHHHHSHLFIYLFILAAHIKLVVVYPTPPCCDFLTDSAETSKAKVTVEMSHSSVKMRAAAQLPAVGPDDDLTGMLLQVGLLVKYARLLYACLRKFYSDKFHSFAANCIGPPPAPPTKVKPACVSPCLHLDIPPEGGLPLARPCPQPAVPGPAAGPG